ncbi:MAG: hypothetical protein IT428_20980 [Planctomycetaceae bacterium]|nr:hypothetical protein [Planctomycetaceae bacterium]
MPTHKPNPILLAFVVSGVLLGLYVGAYYAMVKPHTNKFHNMIGASLVFVSPRYRLSGEGEGGFAERVFAPMHGLDRRMRPYTWQGPIPTKADWDAFLNQGMPRTVPVWDFSKGPPW